MTIGISPTSKPWLSHINADWCFTSLFGCALIGSSLGSELLGIFTLALSLWSLVWIIVYRRSVAPLTRYEKIACIFLILFFIEHQFSRYVIGNPTEITSGGYAHFLLVIIPLYIHARHRTLIIKHLLYWGIAALVVALISASWQVLVLDTTRASMIFKGHEIMFGDFVLVTTLITLATTLTIPASIKARGLAIAVAVFGTTSVLLSGTRGAYIAIPLSLFLLYLGSKYIGDQHRLISKKLVVVCLVCGALLLTGIALTDKGRYYVNRAEAMIDVAAIAMNTNLDSQSLGTIDSYADRYRIIMLIVGWQMFLEKPVFGHGWGSFSKGKHDFVAKSSFLAGYSEENKNRFLGFNQPHNDYIRFLCEQGLVGFTFLMLLLCVPLWWLWCNITHNRGQQQLQIMALIGALVALAYMHFYLTEGITGRSAMFSHQLVLLTIYISQVSHLKRRINTNAHV